MSKGLEALHHPRIELARIDISTEGLHDIAYMPFYKTKQYTAIEEELNDLDTIKKIFNDYGLEFKLTTLREAVFLLKQLQGEKSQCWDNALKKLKAFDIIRKSGYISIDEMLSQNYITRKEYDSLKEVRL